MKFKERIKTLFNNSKSNQVETIIISVKQCPQYASRGMFVFNSSSKSKINNGKLNDKNN